MKKEALEQIISLENMTGREFDAVIDRLDRNIVGNLDDGEITNENVTMTLTKRFVLDNVYAKPEWGSLTPVYIACRATNGERVLLPLCYSFVESWYIAQSIHTVYLNLKTLMFANSTNTNMPERIEESNVSDGYKYIGGDTSDNSAYMFPLLAKQGGRYDTEMNAVRGDIEQLTKGMVRLWDDGCLGEHP